VRGELLAFDRFEQGSGFSFAQLLCRFTLAAAIGATCHRADRRLGVPLVTRDVLVAWPIVR
jgi:hypothetical protein